MLTTAFTPYSEENMTGYLAGTLDDAGRPSPDAAEPAALAPRARPVAGQPADPRQPRA